MHQSPCSRAQLRARVEGKTDYLPRQIHTAAASDHTGTAAKPISHTDGGNFLCISGHAAAASFILKTKDVPWPRKLCTYRHQSLEVILSALRTDLAEVLGKKRLIAELVTLYWSLPTEKRKEATHPGCVARGQKLADLITSTVQREIMHIDSKAYSRYLM